MDSDPRRERTRPSRGRTGSRQGRLYTLLITRLTSRYLPLIVVAVLLIPARGGAQTQPKPQPQVQKTVRVSVDGASILSAPTVPSTVLSTVKVGTVLGVLAQAGEWYRVWLPGDPTRIGYILAREVESAPDQLVLPGSAPAGQPGAAAAQGSRRRAYLSILGGYMPAPLDFDTSTTFTKNVEEGTLDVAYENQTVPVIDVGAGVEVYRGLFLAASMSYASGTSDVTIDQEIPHPFFFDRTRRATATVAGLPRDELALHLQAAWILPVGRRIQLSAAGGPTLFRLDQTLVTDVDYIEEYPFDSVVLDDAVTEIQRQFRWGFNVQVNVITMLSRHLGVDGLIRYSRATVPFDGPDESTLDVPAGGFEVGVGVRFGF